MKRTIQDLFEGKIVPCEMKHVDSEKYLDALKHLDEVEDQLLASLDDQGRGIYETFQDAEADVTAERDVANFVYGFQLCAELLLGK